MARLSARSGKGVNTTKVAETPYYDGMLPFQLFL